MTTFEQNSQQTTTDEAGAYRFENIPADSNKAYVVRALYNDRIFSAPPVRGNPDIPEIDVPVTIYNVTTDTSVIEGRFISMRILPGTGALQGMQVMGFANTSDAVYTTENLLEEDIYATLTLPLPPLGVMLPTQDSQRFVLAEGGREVYDTTPVFPTDEHILQVPFEFPYAGNTTIDFTMDYPLIGTFEIFVAEPLRIENTEMTIAETFTDESTGLTFNIYTTPLELAAGETFSYTIAGEVPTAAASDSVSSASEADSGYVSSEMLAVILAGVGLLFLVIAIVLTVVSRRNAAPEQQSAARTQDIIVQEIALLDARYEAGDVDEVAYTQQRTKLKAELAALLKEA